MSKKKSKKSSNLAESQVETPEEKEPEQVVPAPQAKSVKQEEPLTLEAIHKELNDLGKLVLDYGQQVASLRDSLVRKLLSKHKYCLKLRELG